MEVLSGGHSGAGTPQTDGVLVAFADAIVSRDPRAIATARQAVIATLGEPQAVDAAAVASNFIRMVRIADATGIPLDQRLADLTAEVRAELGLKPREP